MISELDYLLGWVVYLVAAAAGFLVWWQMTRPIRLDVLREVLRLLVFVVLFTPWYASPEQDAQRRGLGISTEIVLGEAQQLAETEERIYLAPALIITLLEAVFDGPAHAQRGFRPTLFAMIAGLALMIPAQLFRALYRRRKQHA